MDYTTDDRKFTKQIVDQLELRWKININKEVGCAHLTPSIEDRISAEVVITKDDIRNATGRDKVRHATLSAFAAELNSASIDAKVENDKIFVRTKHIVKPENEFTSLIALRARNAKDLERDPELGDNPDW